jgi:type I restriction enzyme S subunit
MKEGWKDRDFVECLKKVPKQKAVKSKDYLDVGLYPIVSQESCLVSGYSNLADILYKHDRPVVIFGDHTKNVKYVDFDFIVGADGVHIFDVKDDILPKFFYYELSSIKLRDLGYARHYKLLKEKRISFPSLSEQERIVSYLDAEFAKIDALKANIEQQLQASKDLFQSALKEMLTPKEGWERKMLKDVSTIIGGSTPKTSDASNWGGNNNWVTPAELNGEKYYGKTKRTISDKAAKEMQLLPVGTVLLSSRAPIGKVAITTEPMYCNQGFKNIVCSNVLYNEYVYWYILFSVPQLEALGIGATFKELSKSRTEEFPISFPSLSEQERIAARLDAISEKVKALQANYDQTINLCNDLKQSLLKSIFE